MVVITLRHARPDYSRDPLDPVLAIEGGMQAHVTARALSIEGVTHMFASPFRRATETAGVISEVLGLSVESQPLLSEYFIPDAMRDFRGLTRTELHQRYPFLTFPDGFPEDHWWPEWPETEEDVSRRLAKWGSILFDRFGPTKSVLLNVGHGASAKALIEAFAEPGDLPNEWTHEHCGFSRVTVDAEGKGTVDYLNRIAYNTTKDGAVKM